MIISTARFVGVLLVVSFLVPPLLAADLALEDFRDPKGNWMLVGDVRLSDDSPRQLSFDPGEGILVNSATGRTSNLLTKAEFGNVVVELEVFVPKDGNSGVYLQVRYEVQIRDSHGVNSSNTDTKGPPHRRFEARCGTHFG